MKLILMILIQFFRNSASIKVTNQRFDLNTTYEELKHNLDIWGERGSGWIIDKIVTLKE